MPPSSANTLTADWSIELAGDHPVARFAAQELRRTLQRIGAPALPVVERVGGRRIALRHGEDGDGFVRVPDDNGLVLTGDGPRGLLYAVYDLLEALGCRWVAPGPTGEQLPRYERVELPHIAIAQRPALPGRCLIIGHDFFLDVAEEWIVWAARNRLNTIFIHTIDQRLALGACHLRRWRGRRAALLPLLHERGMVLELGGHGMTDLVPRRLFRSASEAFRYDGVRRTPDHNFCPTSPQAQALLRRSGEAFFRAHPEAAIFHLWPDDILGGGWCRCPGCAHLSPSDQALLAVNELAAVLATVHPRAKLAYLAYHDTEAPPTQVAPRPNVALTYAPRPRSYAHGIADSSSAVNGPFWEHLRGNITWFHHTRIFEYYLDGILFKSALPPLPAVIRADMRAYRDAGVHTVQALMTGDRPWVAAPLNAYLFARLAWEPEQEPEALLSAYAAVCAPRAPAALACAYTSLAAAWQPALDFAPDEQTLVMEGKSGQEADKKKDAVSFFLSPFDFYADVLDYMAAPRLLRERRLEALAAIEPLLAQGRAAWAEVIEHAHADRPHLEAEQAEWELGARWLHYITLRQQLYVLEARNASRAGLQAALREAQAALDGLSDWGRTQLTAPRARANYALLRLLAQFHLDAVRDRWLAWPWQRLALRLRAVCRLARLVVRLRRW